jgi:Phage Terminase
MGAVETVEFKSLPSKRGSRSASPPSPASDDAQTVAITWASKALAPPVRTDPCSPPPAGDPGGTQGALRGRQGSALPRIATKRPPGGSFGPLVVQFATEVLHVDLLPWQVTALDHGLVKTADDHWASRTVSIMVGRQNGKTLLTAVRALAGMYLWGEQVIAASQNRDVALDAWNTALELATDAGLHVNTIARTTGREAFSISKARYKVVSSTRSGGRGLSADLVIMDEVREYRDWAAWAALEKTRRARISSQVWAISNEGDEGSTVLCSLSERGRTAAAAGTATDAAWLEWSAPPEAMRSDPDAWAAANPAMGWLISEDVIASEAATDDPEVFETEVLCRRVASLHPWLPPGMWDACADPMVNPPADDAPVVFAIEAGPELRHATIAVASKRDDGRTFIEAINGYQASDGEVLPRAAVRLGELCERWHPLAVLVCDRSQAQAAARRVLEASSCPVVALNGADQVRAASAFHEACIARQLVHAGDRMTAAHLGSLTADGVLRRRSPSSDVDAAIAVVLAAWGAQTSAPRTAAQDWVAF